MFNKKKRSSEIITSCIRFAGYGVDFKIKNEVMKMFALKIYRIAFWMTPQEHNLKGSLADCNWKFLPTIFNQAK